eukprot:18757-Heterococcus_DN1.PRE.1
MACTSIVLHNRGRHTCAMINYLNNATTDGEGYENSVAMLMNVRELVVTSEYSQESYMHNAPPMTSTDSCLLLLLAEAAYIMCILL